MITFTVDAGHILSAERVREHCLSCDEEGEIYETANIFQ
jgi:hypothetical protein